MATKRVVTGGCFAPPLSDEALDRYATLASQAAPPIRDAMRRLLACVEKWWNLPESQGDGTAHSSGKGVVIPLDAAVATDLDEHIPWAHELDAIQRLFNEISASERDLRNAAFHLLWHVKELDLGQEPITTDKL